MEGLYINFKGMKKENKTKLISFLNENDIEYNDVLNSSLPLKLFIDTVSNNELYQLAFALTEEERQEFIKNNKHALSNFIQQEYEIIDFDIIENAVKAFIKNNRHKFEDKKISLNCNCKKCGYILYTCNKVTIGNEYYKCPQCSTYNKIDEI